MAANTSHEKEERSGRQAKKDGELSVLVGTVEQWEDTTLINFYEVGSCGISPSTTFISQTRYALLVCSPKSYVLPTSTSMQINFCNFPC